MVSGVRMHRIEAVRSLECPSREGSHARGRKRVERLVQSGQLWIGKTLTYLVSGVCLTGACQAGAREYVMHAFFPEHWD